MLVRSTGTILDFLLLTNVSNLMNPRAALGSALAEAPGLSCARALGGMGETIMTCS
jgi:hypothetical protein